MNQPPQSQEQPTAEGVDAAGQSASGKSLIPAGTSLSGEKGIQRAALADALDLAASQRGDMRLLTLAGFYSRKQDEREERLEAKLAGADQRIRELSDQVLELRAENARLNGAQEERDRFRPVQPLLAASATLFFGLGLDAVKSGHNNAGAAMLIASGVLILASLVIAYWPKAKSK